MYSRSLITIGANRLQERFHDLDPEGQHGVFKIVSTSLKSSPIEAQKNRLVLMIHEERS